MRIIAIRGRSDSGKTETALALIRELRRRGYSVIAGKDVHQGSFSIDTPGKDSFRLGEASGEAVIVRGPAETSFLYRRRLSAEEIAARVEADFLVLEGFRDLQCANIACAKDEEGLAREVDELTIAVSGVVAETIREYRGLPALSALTNAAYLADIVERATPMWEGL